jgi:predicted transposase YbfD/YdcC
MEKETLVLSEGICFMEVVALRKLGDILQFSEITDPRLTRQQLHSLSEILFMVLCGGLFGLSSWEEIADFGKLRLTWFRQFHAYANGAPSHDTLNRVMGLLNPRELEIFLVNWVNGLSVNLSGKMVHIDGKSLRGSVEKRLLNQPLSEGGQRLKHVVCAWSSELSLCLGQYQVEDKTNEIKAIPNLLSLLDLKGSIITIDAMGCQTEIVNQIVAQEADYILALKGNQGNLQKAVVDFFEKADAATLEKAVEHDKGHGRVEMRTCSIANAKDVLPAFLLEKWTNLQTIVKIEAKVMVMATQKETIETRYYIGSIVERPSWYNTHIRAHWTIENQLNWRLDVIWKEDGRAKQFKNAAQNHALINRIALNIHGKNEEKISVNRKTKKCLADDGYRENVLINFAKKQNNFSA